jgi:hypothetical protein
VVRRGISDAGVRWRWGAVTALVTLAAVAPAVRAHASSLQDRIANGRYATVFTPGVPSGEQLSLSIVNNSIATMELTCFPSDAVAPLLHGSHYANVFIIPPVARIHIVQGHFRYSGSAAVSSTPRLADKVTTAKFTLKGSYLPAGPSYHYFSALDNEVISTLVFQGTATTTACVGLPANRTFRLYATRF